MFECGAAAAAPDWGVVDSVVDSVVDRTLELGCGQPETVGPRDSTIWTAGRVEFVSDGAYLISLRDELGEAPPVKIELAQCQPCGSVYTFAAGDWLTAEPLLAGRYAVEVRADEGSGAGLGAGGHQGMPPASTDGHSRRTSSALTEDLECSSTDNNSNWGANGEVPDANWVFGSCYVNCACNN